MERRDCLWENGPCFYYDTELFAPGTDSFALGYFAKPKRGDRVCDLGSGTGLLGVLLSAREPTLTLTLVEWQEKPMALAEKTYAENGYTAQTVFRCGDLRLRENLPAAGSVDYVVCNPPYFRGGSGESAATAARKIAREEVGCTIDDICTAAAYVLRWGGRMAMVYRQERLVDALVTMRKCGIEPKRLRFLHKDVVNTNGIFLVEGIRGGKPQLTIEPPLVIDSAEWEAVYFRKRKDE